MYITETARTMNRYKGAGVVKTADDPTASLANQVTPTTVPGETGVTPGTAETESVDSSTSEFAAFMQKAVGKSSTAQVSEEELFAGLIEQRLGKVSQEAADYYAAEKAKLAGTMVRPNGTVPWEDVANAALKNTVAAGKIDRTQAGQINGEAFSAAQLDDNLGALYDDRGGANDPTIAVSAMEAALLKLRTVVDKLDSGELKIDARDIDLPSTGAASAAPVSASASTDGGATASSNSSNGSSSSAQAADGPGGFVWKPVSDSNGKLAVLVPSNLSGLIDRMEIHSALPATEATKLAEGRYDKDTNGGRPTFRFDKPGAEFGENIHVVVFKNDGSQLTYDIADGGTRVD